MGRKVDVTKEAYEQVRALEASKGIKITDAEWMLFVSECVNGIWGVYQITRCYKSFEKYYASFKIIEVARSKTDAEDKVFEYSK